ncbi:hypothetical protein GYMLUDRAFT_244698 [Collybiopsis luxurians FD-317 M1]|uniref:Uncharacterized protein n=1 Tax=Collybiopsis luxurians FD-317 M1 TaxID=944289 RepID=A0A0D0CMP9_9AGAR|nr:hypothetical protein GYMLUDRAFT_244698 [Collybiopsis luxurians FD-317 M1]
MPANVNLPVPHNQTSQPAIQLILKRPALINLFKPTVDSPTGSLSSGSHQQCSCIHGQAVCQPTYPHSHSSACAPQPANSSYRRSPSPSRQLFNLQTWTEAMMVMTWKH